MPAIRSPLPLALPLLLLLALDRPAAAETNVLTLRVASLDALTAAARPLGEAGVAIDADRILDALPFGVGRTPWVDRTRPLVAVLPQNGVMAAGRTWVLAVPRKDAASLEAWVSATYPQAVAEGELRSLGGEDPEPGFLRTSGDYVVLGQTRSFVERFELASALDPRDLPPGPVAVEVLLEPLAPLAQMAIAQARAADLGAAAGSGVDPQTMTEFLGLYLDLANDIVSNVSRLQLALDVGSGRVKLVQRLLPRAGSTLAGMLAAQQGGLPEIARHADARGAALVIAGQLELTTAFRAALETYVQRYSEKLRALDAAGAAAGSLGAWLGPAQTAGAGFLDCYRGDTVEVLRLDASGIRSAGLATVVDAERCRAALATMLEALGQTPAAAGGEPLVEVEPDALVHAGVHASRQTWRLPPSTDPQTRAPLERLGVEAVTTYRGLLGSLLLSASGSAADQAFRSLVDRAAGQSRGSGVDAAAFAPLTVGPGYFVRADLAALAPLWEPPAEAAGAERPAGDRTLLLGVRLAPDSATVEVLFPVAALPR